MPTFRSRFRPLALALALAAVAAACTGEPTPPPATPPAPATGPATGPVTAGQTGAVGAKWDWGRVGSYTPYLRRLAGGATFFELVWCDVEPQQGKRDWSRVDEVVRSGRQLGFTMFLKLRVGGGCWATRGEGGFLRGEQRQKTASAMPADLSAYQAWVRDAVTRYKAMGVHQYALENEVDAPSFWAGTPADYDKLARAGAKAVHAADPGARVLDSGLTSTVYGFAMADRLLGQGREAEAVAAWQRYNARRFLKGGKDFPEATDAAGLRAALAGERARRNLALVAVTRRLAEEHVTDAWQLHFYESWDSLPGLLAFLHGTLPAGFPVEAWEAGNFWPGGPDDQRVRAAEVTKVVSLLLAGGVRPVIWLPLAYNPSLRDDELRLGLVDPDGGVRPAGEAVAGLAADAAGGASWRPVATGAVDGVAFTRGDQSTLVVWSERGAVLPGPGASGAQAETVAGQTLPWGSGGLELGQDPVRISVPADAGTALKLLATARG